MQLPSRVLLEIRPDMLLAIREKVVPEYGILDLVKELFFAYRASERRSEVLFAMVCRVGGLSGEKEKGPLCEKSLV